MPLVILFTLDATHSCPLIFLSCQLVSTLSLLTSWPLAGWLLCRLSMCHHLVVSSHLPLTILSCQLDAASSLVFFQLLCHPLIVSSCRLVVALPLLLSPPSRPLVVPAIFASPSPYHSYHHHHQMLANTIAHHQMLLPLLSTTATPTIECHLYHPSLQQLHSIATIKCQCPPLTIAAVKH